MTNRDGVDGLYRKRQRRTRFGEDHRGVGMGANEARVVIISKRRYDSEL